ncbi:hypothetical protein HUT19_34460 [Streptomyces sp. NA02950]|uniref:hypothetical protein n=1 Tax=Streptomyces sp. NA02950 TaxID=2742137 RepID=UPI001590ACD0|nr:hypothetical protein [Streptomyces sp. NA02950]QKV96195.1 hypothetical protein HUT19_34460 [Streptomyces sp. NA02950]
MSRRPGTALAVATALLVAAHRLDAGIVPAPKVLAAVVLFELAAVRSGRAPVAGAAVLALATRPERGEPGRPRGGRPAPGAGTDADAAR